MRAKWLVTYYGPEGKWLTRWFRSLTEASHFRTEMQCNIRLSDRDQFRSTVWHQDDLMGMVEE
jgi:hypothetical protein